MKTQSRKEMGVLCIINEVRRSKLRWLEYGGGVTNTAGDHT